METQILNLLTDASLRIVPIIAVMWYMLKDLRSSIAEVKTNLSDLQMKIAADQSALKLDHTNEKLSEFKAETKSDISNVNVRLHYAEKQLTKIWSKIGDRPEDIKLQRRL